MSIEAFYIITLDNVILLIIGPMFSVVECLKLFDYQNCTLEERQFHDASFGFLIGLCLLRCCATLGCGEHLR